MEPMKIRVLKVVVYENEGFAVGKAVAISKRRIQGKSTAVLQLMLRVPCYRGEPTEEIEERIYDKTLEVLDPA